MRYANLYNWFFVTTFAPENLESWKYDKEPFPDQDLMTRLTAKQKALLLALAHSEKDVQPTSGQFIRKYHLTSASAVQRSLSALQEKDIVTSNNGQYFIYDYFLYYWLKQQ